jgi:hypothetical protein
MPNWERRHAAYPLNKCASFNHETLKILARAFDEAWPFVAVRTHDYLSMLVRRERLANIVLDLGIKGERDVEKLKFLALQRLDDIDSVQVDSLH